MLLMAQFVTFEIADGIGTITLNRPPVNALSRAVQEELREAARMAAQDHAVKSVIVHGGTTLFSVGADVKEMSSFQFVEVLDVAHALQSALGAISEIPKPVVAAISGYALGGGLEIALSADRRIMSETAKVGLPEILLGIIPGAGGTQRLSRLIGPSRAKDMVFTGRFLDATEALSLGVVDQVVAPDEVYNAAWQWASQFTGAASRAIAAAKASIDDGLEADLVTGLRIEAQHFASLFATEDRTIGMESFIASGAGHADFHGR